MPQGVQDITLGIPGNRLHHDLITSSVNKIVYFIPRKWQVGIAWECPMESRAVRADQKRHSVKFSMKGLSESRSPGLTHPLDHLTWSMLPLPMDCTWNPWSRKLISTATITESCMNHCLLSLLLFRRKRGQKKTCKNQSYRIFMDHRDKRHSSKTGVSQAF